MAKTGKRHTENKEGINSDIAVELQEAISLIKGKANGPWEQLLSPTGSRHPRRSAGAGTKRLLPKSRIAIRALVVHHFADL